MTPKAVERFALALPGAELSIKWGNDRCYCVGGKMFAAMSAAKQPTLSFKTSDVGFEILTAREGVIPAPYAARFKWVQLASLKVMDDGEIRERLVEAHRLIVEKLPKRLRPV